MQQCVSQNPATTDAVRVTSSDRKPAVVVQPVYPDEAKRAGIKGTGVLDVTVGETGHVDVARPVSGPKELWAAATEAVEQWKWEPFLLNEKPVRVRTKAVVKFVLESKDAPNGNPKARH